MVIEAEWMHKEIVTIIAKVEGAPKVLVVKV
jgi:hypothetical protein